METPAAAFDGKLIQRWINQESGNRPGILGPVTKYGQAKGLTQLLDSTAAEMARKVGVPFNPALLTDKTPVGADYQLKLGRAYLDEGFRKTGNVRDAFRYYHGGPNRRQWGPKTNAYASAILGGSQ